jgi:hypothetical protein
MSSLIKFSDRISGVNAKLSELQATTANLSLAEKQTLLASLEKDVQAAVAKEDAPKQRLAAIQAAAASTNARMKDAYVTASKGLAKLGYALDSIAASGSIADVKAKMREHKWTDNQKIGLKAALARIGAIS